MYDPKTSIVGPKLLRGDILEMNKRQTRGGSCFHQTTFTSVAVMGPTSKKWVSSPSIVAYMYVGDEFLMSHMAISIKYFGLWASRLSLLI